MEAPKSMLSWGVVESDPKDEDATDNFEKVQVGIALILRRSIATGEYAEGAEVELELPDDLRTIRYENNTTVSELAAVICERLKILEYLQGGQVDSPPGNDAPPHVA